jgi:hypothetical protein
MVSIQVAFEWVEDGKTLMMEAVFGNILAMTIARRTKKKGRKKKIAGTHLV